RRRAAKQRDERTPFHGCPQIKWPTLPHQRDEYAVVHHSKIDLPMSVVGHTRSFGDVASMSELPSRAVVERKSVHGRKVPEAAVSSRSKQRNYSITSSAVASNLSGTVRPSILAVS